MVIDTATLKDKVYNTTYIVHLPVSVNYKVHQVNQVTIISSPSYLTPKMILVYEVYYLSSLGLSYHLHQSRENTILP